MSSTLTGALAEELNRHSGSGGSPAGGGGGEKYLIPDFILKTNNIRASCQSSNKNSRLYVLADHHHTVAMKPTTWYMYVYTHMQRLLSQLLWTRWQPWPQIFQRRTVSDRQGPVLPVTLKAMVVKVGVGMRRDAGDGGNPYFFIYLFLPLPQIPKHASRHWSRSVARAPDIVTSNMTVISLASSGETPLSTS